MSKLGSFPKMQLDEARAAFVENYIQQVLSGNVDTQLLRTTIGGRANSWMLQMVERETGLKSIVCDRCEAICFACKSTSVYGGAYQVCDFCAPSYSFCETCNYLILSEDLHNPTHIHDATPAKVLFNHEEEDENSHVAGYDADIMHERPQVYFTTPEEQRRTKHRFFGVELEVEKVKAGPSSLDHRVIKSIRKDFFLLKHDGSLSQKGKGGFEIVSMPATLLFHQGGIWDTFFQHCAPFFEEAPATASLHVHFNTDSVTEGTLGKIGQFINDQDNKEFLANVAHRELGIANPNGKIYMKLHIDQKAAAILSQKSHVQDCPWHPRNIHTSNRYALKNKTVQRDELGNPFIASLKPSDIIVRPACKCPDGNYLIEDHYSAFNLKTKRPTAELRIFRGVVKKGFLFAALEFTDALINFCANVAPSDLHYQRFLVWCENQRKSYSNLTKLLVIRGWIEPPKSRRNMELETNRAYADA